MIYGTQDVKDLSGQVAELQTWFDAVVAELASLKQLCADMLECSQTSTNEWRLMVSLINSTLSLKTLLTEAITDIQDYRIEYYPQKRQYWEGSLGFCDNCHS